MNEPMIQIEGMAKKYKVNRVERYLALRDKFADCFKKPFEFLMGRGSLASSKEDFWALEGVSCDIKKGEVVGLIGRNGSGKTTLLKILSRITYPSRGEILLRGRVSSLLEVGTGFHPELSGRENIYFNGSILGMKKGEIARKFDEIVAFAEVERFIDTPVKRYSSGMQVRLAFAVAAHLEPEILLVDEVLAVGDAQFQKKCLGKMKTVAECGRTVVFVSHSMETIQRLCPRVILLNEGKLVKDGTAEEVIRKYLEIGAELTGERVWQDRDKAPGNDIVRLLGICTKDQSGQIRSQFDVRDPILIEIRYDMLKEGHKLCMSLEVLNTMGRGLFVSVDDYVKGDWRNQDPHPPGSFKSTCLIPGDLLTEGDISISLWMFSPPARPNLEAHICEREVINLSVTDKMDPGGVRGNYPYNWGNPAVRPRLYWNKEKI